MNTLTKIKPTLSIASSNRMKLIKQMAKTRLFTTDGPCVLVRDCVISWERERVV